MGGDADCELVAVGHADGFNGDAVAELQQVLAGAVLRNLLDKLLGNIEGESLGQLLAQRSREIGHVLKRTDVLLVNPFVELLCAESGLAEFFDEVLELLKGEKTYIT